MKKLKKKATRKSTEDLEGSASTEVSATRTGNALSAAQPRRVSIEFFDSGARKVFIAGSFNDWRPEQTALEPRSDGRWVGELEAAPGKYEYLFVVDGKWVVDPKAAETAPNPFGGKNAVLTVSA